ncbi:Uncharacterised protein [Ectopseudomonas mendocina]|nr:Uncharacterised protein [Pseudomonas mendocina]
MNDSKPKLLDHCTSRTKPEPSPSTAKLSMLRGQNAM